MSGYGTVREQATDLSLSSNFAAMTFPMTLVEIYASGETDMGMQEVTVRSPWRLLVPPKCAALPV